MLYDTENIPLEIKEANLVRIHRSGSKNSPSIYRPVSLTPIISKVFEGLIKDVLEDYVEVNNIKCENQHGFGKGKSTCTNLLDSWQELTDLVDKTQSVFILNTGFRNTFDSIPQKSGT